MEIEEIIHSTRTPWKSHTLWTMERHWITFPFIIAAMAWLMSARGGWVSNLIVYPKSIDAAQILNLVNNYGSLIPVLAAIIVYSFFGWFSVIWISSFISLLARGVTNGFKAARKCGTKYCAGQKCYVTHSKTGGRHFMNLYEPPLDFDVTRDAIPTGTSRGRQGF